MKAVINGVHVEGTPEEIVEYQQLIIKEANSKNESYLNYSSKTVSGGIENTTTYKDSFGGGYDSFGTISGGSKCEHEFKNYLIPSILNAPPKYMNVDWVCNVCGGKGQEKKLV